LRIPVKLPKEVLNLFPTWEYRCPDCSTYVESNKSFCPNCKTAFDKKRWRVPPRFLKSYEAMSKYAHKVLAPKLTPKQRELLFQYFTEIFSDGFESGDFSAWTGTYEATGCTTEVISTDPHHGTYHAHFETDADGNGARANRTFTGQTTVYSRAYFKFLAFPSSTQSIGMTHRGTDTVTNLQLLVSGSDHYWRLRGRNGATYENNDGTTVLSLNIWYCIELETIIHASAGEHRLYLNGVEECALTGKDTDNYGNITSMRIGLTYCTVATNIYVDCVVVADTYIGPETTEQTYTKTWTTDALFKKLGIAKSLSVDTAFQKQNIPKTFGLDSTFQKSFTIQKQIDVLFKKLDILETFGIDIDFLKRNVIKSFAVDVRFGALMTHTISRQIDVLLKKLDATKTFGLDVYFGPVEAEAYAKNFALDVIFAYKVRLPELWLDENGKIVLNISKPYTWVGT